MQTLSKSELKVKNYECILTNSRRSDWKIPNKLFRARLFYVSCLAFLLLLSGNFANAQTPCKTGCTSNDVQIKSAYLMQDRNGNSLQACASGTPVQAYLYLDLTTNTPRVGVSITANLYNKATGTLVQAVGECFGQSLSSSGTTVTTVIFTNPISWSCGAPIELREVLIGWGTGSGNFCVSSAPQCPATSSKCWKQGPTSPIQVVTFPCTPAAITSQPVNQDKCINQNATFTVGFNEGDPATASIQWKVSSDNGSTWTNLANAAPYSGVTSSTLSIMGTSLALNGNRYKAVLTNNTSTHNCSAETNGAATLTVYAPPTVATVGTAQDICGTLTSGALGGNNPAIGAGAWSQKSGPGTSTFSNVSSGSSTATVSAVGTYVFTWTISNGPCASTSADITVNYYATPTTATVGATQNMCGTLTSGALGGNTPTVGAGKWTQKSGPGTSTFSASASGSSTATVSTPGTYVFTWSVTNGTCTASTADVTVNYYGTPTTATVGTAQNMCGTLTSGSLGGNNPTVGIGAWSKKSGPGTVSFSNAADRNATATVSQVGTYEFTWTISNGTCATSSATITVVYYATPTTASVGSNQIRCATLTSDVLGGNAPTVGAGAWSKKSGPGTVTFSNTADRNATATVSAVGTYVFTWSISNGTCAASTADITVDYYNLPVLTAAVSTQPTCLVPSGVISVTSAKTGLSFSLNSTTDFTNTTGEFTGLAPGNYSVRARNNVSGCISPKVDLVVNAVAGAPDAPTIEILEYATPAVATGTLKVLNSITGLEYGAGYEFKNDGYDLTNWTTNPVFTYTAGMGYTIKIRKTNDNTCIVSKTCPLPTGGARLAAPVTTPQPTGVNQSSGSEMKAFPVPFSKKVTITFTADKDENYVVNLYDMQGRQLRELKAGNAKAGEVITIEVSGVGMPESMYLARKVSRSGIQTVKLLKKEE